MKEIYVVRYVPERDSKFPPSGLFGAFTTLEAAKAALVEDHRQACSYDRNPTHEYKRSGSRTWEVYIAMDDGPNLRWIIEHIDLYE